MIRNVRTITGIALLGALLVVGGSAYAQKSGGGKGQHAGSGQKGGDPAKPPADKATGPYKTGDTVKDFKLADVKGNNVSFSDFAGKTIVIFFYTKDTATGESVPAIEKEIAEGQKEHGVMVLGITTDDAASAKALVEKHAITFPVLVDKDKEVTKAFGASKTPYCAIVNPKGKLVHTQANADAKSLIAKLQSLEAKHEAKEGKDKDKDSPPEKKP
jgi:thioredoxin-dependent peroxiredoxin